MIQHALSLDYRPALTNYHVIRGGSKESSTSYTVAEISPGYCSGLLVQQHILAIPMPHYTHPVRNPVLE